MKRNVLILGASYGSLLGTKLSMAGHESTLVCTKSTADLVNREGTRVRVPVRGRAAPLEIASTRLPGRVRACTSDTADPAACDLVVLAMQEAHYGSPGVRELMMRLARARKPCLAIMNMPPLPYLARIPGLATEALHACYAHPRVWADFDPRLVTLASPDPQAFRPPGEPKNVLQVGLATNFKAARFEDAGQTALLRELERDIEAARLDRGGEAIEVPVKLKVHDSMFVPLAKWPMLVTGNYRCIGAAGMVSIREAVRSDVDASRAIYAWVSTLCARLGAQAGDLVPFDKYLAVADDLRKPSAAARALSAGALQIERVDRLIRAIGRGLGLELDALDEIVAVVDERLAHNRSPHERPTHAPAAAPVGAA